MFSSAASNGITIGLDIANQGDDVESGLLAELLDSRAVAVLGGAPRGAVQEHPEPDLAGRQRHVLPVRRLHPGPPYTTGVTGTGDTHLWSAWYNAETTSRYLTDTNASEDWGVSNAAFNFGYTYNAGTGTSSTSTGRSRTRARATCSRPSGVTGTSTRAAAAAGTTPPYDRALRQEWWWTLASGARGILGEAENVYHVVSGQLPRRGHRGLVLREQRREHRHRVHRPDRVAQADPGHVQRPGHRGQGHPGRPGTPPGGPAGSTSRRSPTTTSPRSKTPDGTLAVLYLPLHTTITVNQSLLTPGYTATWIDPVSRARRPPRPREPRTTPPPRAPTPRVTRTGCWCCKGHKRRHRRRSTCTRCAGSADGSVMGNPVITQTAPQWSAAGPA